jgi:hypothetical protein
MPSGPRSATNTEPATSATSRATSSAAKPTRLPSWSTTPAAGAPQPLAFSLLVALPCVHACHFAVLSFRRLAARPATLAYSRESAFGTGTFPFFSGGAGGRPVTSRISSSSRVSRSSKALASTSSSLRWSASRRRASS